jgi:hypothetical protein
MATHYVDNKELYKCISAYRDSVIEAKLHNTERPRIPNYVGECILMIANRLSTKPNFINYSYRDDMVSDGIENCICYIDNFDPAKSTNPFAYFTQIIYYAFLRRILKEKKQTYIKHKTLENSMLLNDLYAQGEFSEQEFTPTHIDLEHDSMFDFIKSFEDNLLSKKKKRAKKGVERFVEEDILSEDEVDGHVDIEVEGIDIDEEK